jgi:hypothetical protein
LTRPRISAGITQDAKSSMTQRKLRISNVLLQIGTRNSKQAQSTQKDTSKMSNTTISIPH